MRLHLVAATLCTAVFLGLSGTASAGIWSPYASGTTQDITAIDYRAPDQLYYATANGQIFRNATLMAGSPGAGITFTGIQLNPAGTIGLASANNGKLYRWGGASWAAVNLTNTVYNHDFPCNTPGAPSTRSLAPTGNLVAVGWSSDTVAYVPAADRGVVLKTTDGGASWQDVSRQADGTCRVDAGSGAVFTDVATLPGTDLVYVTTDNFGARRFTADGFAGSAVARNNTSVNCFDVRTAIALDLDNPNRNFMTGACSGSLAFGFSSDGGVNYDISQETPNGNASDLTGMQDVAHAGGSALAVGNAGAILVDSDGIHAYFQRADGAEQTTDWLAADKYDGQTGAVGGRGGKLVLSTQANAIPDIVAPAGTISGPTTVTAGQAVQYTANVADNAGGSGVNAGSFAWSATGIPAATGNPVTVTFPSAGFFSLKVSFTDNAGNAGTASLPITVKAPPFPVGTPTPGATKTVTVPGGTVTLSGPRTCIPVGKSFSATLSFKRSRRKGAKTVKITRVDFFIDNKRKKIDRKAPFKQRLTVRSYAAGSKHTLKARAYIKVRRGRTPKKSISTSIRVCSS